MKREDFEQGPCRCGECVQAGVSEQPQMRDRLGRWMHGYELKRTIEAKARFWDEFREKFGKKGMS